MMKKYVAFLLSLMMLTLLPSAVMAETEYVSMSVEHYSEAFSDYDSQNRTDRLSFPCISPRLNTGENS